MAFDAWLGLCEIPTAVCNSFNLSPFECIIIHDSSDSELTTTVVQIVPSQMSDYRLHPSLHEFLSRASFARETPQQQDQGNGFQILPLPLEEPVTDLEHRSCWSFRKPNSCIDLDGCSDNTPLLDAIVIYSEGEVTEKDIEIGLDGRFVKAKSVVAVSTLMGICILVIHSIANSDENAVYRIGPGITTRLIRIDQNVDEIDVLDCINGDTNCPGYEKLLDELYSLCTAKGFALPSGVLLTGCPGVGKTRLASCLANRIILKDHGLVHWVSCQDLIVRASWATESEMMDVLLPRRQVSLVVLDDLHVLSADDTYATNSDHEYTLLRNSITACLDHLTNTAVLGICRSGPSLPPQLIKIDRLEKEVQMNPPTQNQRYAILETLIANHPTWIKALSGPTAGFVASDLHLMYMDAWATSQARNSDDVQWQDLREAVHRAIPSQLALLDVTRPRPFSDHVSNLSPLEMHKRSWKKFGGYSNVKKRVYRTVVAPWYRHLESTETVTFGLSPPRGVLFHGPPGTGKTFASSCLAASLGLNVIKVRASDVLDQWLGGSEAAIRSLFARARGAQPCILFFDEIDAIACNREYGGAESDVSSRILTTLLNELDGISSSGNSGVLVLACTNRLKDLDTALLRPGRLEEHIELKHPSLEEISEILQSQLTNVPLAKDLILDDFAEVLYELEATGADVEGVCRDACSLAIRSIGESDSVVLTPAALDGALRAWKRS